MMRPVLLLLSLVLIVSADPASAQLRGQLGEPGRFRSPPQSMEQLKFSFSPIVKAVSPAVVNVYASRNVRQMPSPFANDPFFRRFFGDQGFGVPQERVQRSLGSGVIVSADGLIVTNNHVIADADAVRVALNDRREFEAEIVLKDEKTDLAVLRIKAGNEPLPFMQFDDSDGLEVGDIVLAIGNPFGVGQTVTSGIVSAIARTQVGVGDMGFFIQTDAAINPGNSGGALVDMDGRLVGINSSIYSRSGGSNGIGFAIPANMVRVVVRSAAGDGVLRRPWLGAQLEPVTPEIAESLGYDRPVGVLVAQVEKKGPAAKAGLNTGDVIVSVDGHEIIDDNALRYRLMTLGIGRSAELAVRRSGKQMTVSLPLEAAPEMPPRQRVDLTGRTPLAGISAVNLSPAVAEELSLGDPQGGVVVSAVEDGSPAARVGFKRGDIIRAINGSAIDDTKSLKRIADQPSRYWDLEIQRGNQVFRSRLAG
ncbi:MAG: DegQ family serine endoprotease [Rhodobiaceae bacterium]|nr:DegQ family serine endoprotease [Rhodobiaceae bacterium]